MQLIQQEVLGKNDSEQLNHTIPYDILPITNLHTSDSDKEIFADYNNGSLIRMFNVNTGECIHENFWNPERDYNFQGSLSVDTFLLVPKVEKGIMRAFSINRKSSHFALTNHTGMVKDAINISGEKTIVTCGDDGNAFLYGIANWSCIGSLQANPCTSANTITEIPFDKHLAIGYENGLINFYDYYKQQLIRQILTTSGPIISISATTKYICAGTRNIIFIYKLTGEFVGIINTEYEITLLKCALGDILGQADTDITLSEISDPFFTELVFVGTTIGIILVFNITNGEHIYTIEGYDESITSITISPKQYIFTSGTHGAIRRFHFPTKECTNIYYKYDGNRSISISNDKKYFCISGTTDCRAKLIEVETGTIKKIFNHHNSIRCSAFVTIGGTSYLITGSWDRKIKQWDYITGELIHTYKTTGNVCDFAIKDNILAAGYHRMNEMGGFQLIDLERREIIFTAAAHNPSLDFARVTVVHIIDDLLISGGDDGILNYWNLKKKGIIKSIKCSTGIRCLASSSDGRYLYVGLVNCQTAMFEVNTGNLKNIFQGHGGSIISLLVINKSLFSADMLGIISKYDLSNNSIEWSLKLHTDMIWKLEQLNSGEILVSVSRDGTVKFISAGNGELLGTYYNMEKGFLWTTPPTDHIQNGYYWTDCLEQISVSAENSNDGFDIKKIDEKRIAEYHAIYNNQKLVMSGINRSKFSVIHKASLIQMKNNMLLNKLIDINQNKLLNE